jgi:hypothetical protein
MAENTYAVKKTAVTIEAQLNIASGARIAGAGVEAAAFTQTYSTADRTVATLTVGSDIGAFTDPPSAAEMALLRTFVNALKADILAMKKNDNAVIDDLQAVGITG